jgi:hypothetical protein
MGNVKSDEYWGSQIQRLINHGKGGFLNVRSVKLFADGMIIHVPFTDRNVRLTDILQAHWDLGELRCSSLTLISLKRAGLCSAHLPN